MPSTRIPCSADVLLPGIVVDEPDRRVAERRRPQHLLDDQLRRVAGSDDERLLAARDDPPGQRPLDQRSGEHAHTGDEGEAEQQIDEPDAARNADAMDREDREDEVHRERAETDAAERAPHVPRRDVAPPAVVEAGEDEDRELDRDDQQHDRGVEVAVVVAGARLVEAKVPRQPPGQRDDRGVDGHVPEPVPVERGASGRDARGRERRSRRPAPAARHRCRAHIGSARSSRPRRARSPAGRPPRSRGSAARAGGGAAAGSTDGGADPRLGQRCADRSRSGERDDEEVVDVARARRRGSWSRRRRARARRSARPPRAAPRPAVELAAGRSRSTAAWISSSREFVPMYSKVPLGFRAVEAEHADALARARRRFTATRPPSPSANRFFVGIEAERRADPGRRDLGRRRTPAPRPRSSARPSAASSASGAGRPKRCTGMIAFVRGVICAATSAGSRLSVTGSMSAKTGVAPRAGDRLGGRVERERRGRSPRRPRRSPARRATRTIASVPLATPIVSARRDTRPPRCSNACDVRAEDETARSSRTSAKPPSDRG